MQDHHQLQAGVPAVVRVFEREYLLSQLRSALQVLIFSVLEGPKDNEPLFNHTLGVGALLRSINGILSHGRRIYNAGTNKHFVSLWDNFIDWFQNKQLFVDTTELITEGDLYVLRTLPDVTSDDIRSLATVAVLLNRRMLHLFLETLLKDQVLIEGYYETYSILYDTECKSTLLLLLRGLNSLNFKLSIIDVPKISNNVGRSSATEEIESSFTESKNLHSTLQISPLSPSSTQSKNNNTQNTDTENFDNLRDFTEPKSPQNPPSSVQQMNDDSKNLLNTTITTASATSSTTSTTSSITSTTQPFTTNIFSKTLTFSDSPQSIDISQFHDVHDDYCGDSDDDDFVFVSEGIRKPFVPVLTTNTLSTKASEKKNKKKKKKKKKNTPKIEDWTPSKNTQDSIDSQTITEPQLSTINIESPTNTTFVEISTATTIYDAATTSINLTTANQHSDAHSPNTPISANYEVTTTFFEPTPNSESVAHDFTTSETIVLLDTQSENTPKTEGQGQGDAFEDDLSSILDHFVEQKKQLARDNLQETLELLINTTLEPVINNVIKKFGEAQNSTTSFSFKRIHKQEEEPSVD